MDARVFFRDVHGIQGVIALHGEPVYVGRGTDCAIRSHDSGVSRKHSVIKLEKGRYWIEDLGSSNGTEVNDARVKRHMLSHNDRVRCGSLWLRYVEDGAHVDASFPPQTGPSPAVTFDRTPS